MCRPDLTLSDADANTENVTADLRILQVRCGNLTKALSASCVALSEEGFSVEVSHLSVHINTAAHNRRRAGAYRRRRREGAKALAKHLARWASEG